MPPLNDLERLMAARDFGPQLYPQFFRLLRKSELVFLIPYHPEMVGEIALKSGDVLPPFVVWKSPTDGLRVPIFTSMDRATEACANTGAREGQYAFCEMLGQQLFDLLSVQENAIVINPACSTPSTFLDLNAARKLADGSILISEPEEQRSGSVKIVDPADYPTDFLQPLFRFLRENPGIKAAWLFREQTPPDAPVSYVFVLKADGDTSAVENDFRIVATSACPKGVDYGVALLDAENAALLAITAQHTPFYAAPDYRAPSPLGEDAPG